MKTYQPSTYAGIPSRYRVEVVVTTWGRKDRRRHLRHIPFHSPDGFAWGYHGSGPADLALAILVDHLGERPPAKGWLAARQFDRWTTHALAWKLHQDFKRDFVARWNEEWKVTTREIDRWLEQHKERNQ